MRDTGDQPYEGIGYCATCDRELGEARKDALGRSIKHKKDDKSPPCLARVILKKNKSAIWWLRKEAWLLKWQNRFSPFAVIRHVDSQAEAGHYLILSTLVILLALSLEQSLIPP